MFLFVDEDPTLQAATQHVYSQILTRSTDVDPDGTSDSDCDVQEPSGDVRQRNKYKYITTGWRQTSSQEDQILRDLPPNVSETNKNHIYNLFYLF